MKDVHSLVSATLHDMMTGKKPLSSQLKAGTFSEYGFSFGTDKWGGVRPFLTTDELAKALQVSVRTLERCREDCIGPRSIKVGHQFRYPIAELDAWVRKSLQQQDAAESPETLPDSKGV